MLRNLGYVLIGLVAVHLGGSACSSAESAAPRVGSGTVPAPETTAVDRSAPAENSPPSEVVSRLIREALRSEGSVSYSTLLKRLGPPQRIETEPVANQYVRGQVDTLRTLQYSGVEALVYDVTDDSKTFLVRLSLSSAKHTTPEGLRVGVSEERVIEELGPPTRRNAARGELVYQESESAPTSMVVRVRNGRVVRIDWEFYFA